MKWAFELTEDAERDLRELPHALQKRVARTLAIMETDPFAGDVKALQGSKWKGVYRRRIGSHRLLFMPDPSTSTVFILRIQL